MKTILLLGAGTGSPDVVARMKSLGVRVILVELRHRVDLEKAAPADKIIVTDYRKQSFLMLATKLRDIWHFDVAVSITEAGVAVAARLNRQFGVRGSDESSITRLNNKHTMRALLVESGFSPVAFAILRTREQVAAFGRIAGFPFIIKPVDGRGSRSIYLVNAPAEAKQAFDDLRAKGLTPLAEEYINGKEYSVESFSFNGKHEIVAITEKIVNDRFVEIGHMVPAMLDEKMAEAVRRFVMEFLALVGVTNGPCHTEMKIGSKGMKIIESHNRIGGDNIPRLVSKVYGIDLIKLTGQWACGLIEGPPKTQAPQGAAAIHFFIFSSGKIVRLDGLQRLKANPSTIDYNCLYNEGDIVPAIVDNVGNSSRSGYVIVHEKLPQDAIRKAMHLAQSVIAVTVPP